MSKKLPKKIRVGNNTYKLVVPNKITYKGATYVRADFADKEDRKKFMIAAKDLAAYLNGKMSSFHREVKSYEGSTDMALGKDTERKSKIDAMKSALTKFDAEAGKWVHLYQDKQKDYDKKLAQWADTFEALYNSFVEFDSVMKDADFGKWSDAKKDLDIVRQKMQDTDRQYRYLVG